MIDKEGWYSVTPECIAKYLAERVNIALPEQGSQIQQEDDSDQEQMDEGNVINVLDAFGGVGGNTIQFGMNCGFCVGVDNDKVKI